MNPTTAGTTLRCQVAGWAAVRAGAANVASLRKQTIELRGEKLPASFQKHAEDQTVVAIAAVLQVLERRDWRERSFADWGVIAAPAMFGRSGIAQTLRRFEQEGAWGVSPNLIPHHSLHALSGTISQALKMHGPNFGLSAGADAFLVAGAMLVDGRLPGLWLVLTGHESEWLPGLDGNPTPPPDCNAIALALTPVGGASASNGGPHFHRRLTNGLQLAIGQEAEPAVQTLPKFQLGLLVDDLMTNQHELACRWRLSPSHWLALEGSPQAEGRS